MTNAFSSSRNLFSRRRLFCAGAMLALGLLAASTHAAAQALPAAEASPISTGFTLPTFGGSLQWAVSASESLSWGYYSQSNVALGSNISGDLAYLSTSRRHPFSMVLAAGNTWGTSNGPSYRFASLGLSQVINVGRWNFVLSDSVSYLPETATTGLSGVAGVGDLGVTPTQVGPDSGQGLLTNYSPEVTNTSAASAARQLTGKTAVNITGSFFMLRFLNGAGASSGSGGFGLESDGVTGSGGFSHRLNARNSFGGNYAYSSVIFLNNHSAAIPAPNFITQTASFTYSHQVSRRLGFNLAAGPEWTRINSEQTVGQNSTSLSAYADASVNYVTEFSHLSLNYVRSTNSGWGVVGGAQSDSVSFNAARVYARVWNTAASVAWSHTASLPSIVTLPYDFQTVVAGFQVSRALARSLSGFASYTVETQSHTSTNGSTDLFNGVNQIFSFGLTYSPVARQFGRP